MNQQASKIDCESTVGEILRAARLDKKLSCKDVANDLKISTHIVEDIESDNLSKMPRVYCHGYLRLYAELVGVEYNQIAVLSEPLTDINDTNDFVNNMPARHNKQWFERTLKVARYAVVTAGVVMPLVWVFTQGALQLSFDDSLQQTQLIPGANEQVTNTLTNNQNGSAPTLSASTAPFSSLSRAVTGIQANEDPTTIEIDSERPQNQIFQNLDGTLGTDNLLSSQQPTVGVTASLANTSSENTDLSTPDITAASDLDVDVLVLEFLDGSWVEITDADGEKLEFDLLEAGQKRTYSGLAPFNIILGQASAVNLTFNGERVDLSPHTRSDVATVVLQSNRPTSEKTDE